MLVVNQKGSSLSDVEARVCCFSFVLCLLYVKTLVGSICPGLGVSNARLMVESGFLSMEAMTHIPPLPVLSRRKSNGAKQSFHSNDTAFKATYTV